MAPVPRLSMEERVRVVLQEEGNSCNKVAQKMKVARTTVQAIVKKHRETGTRTDRKGRGRGKRITDREDVIIIEALRNRRQASNSQPNELRKTFNTEVSARTVRRKWSEVLQSQENAIVD
ncbi:uncharacterized protein [Penaeus vannamei]|uniref:uncharacterized protein n=1 Tax=Penaeus vannamei TaxID=6689 RepID=UPI00387FAA27